MVNEVGCFLLINWYFIDQRSKTEQFDYVATEA